MTPPPSVSPAFCPFVPLPGAARSAPATSAGSVIPRRPRCAVAPASPPAPAGIPAPPPASGTASQTSQCSSLPSPQMPQPQQQPPPPPPPPHGRSPDFHANVGSVIDALRADYPTLLVETPTLDVFRDDMLFSDTSGNRLYGKDAYRTVLFLLRLHVRVMLSNAALSIVSLHYRDDEPGVHVRWRLRAAPRSWAAATGAADPCGTIVDGLSVYYLDHRGFVSHHAMETIVRADRPMVRSLFERVLAVGQIAVVDGARVPASNIYSEPLRNAALRATLEREWKPLVAKGPGTTGGVAAGDKSVVGEAALDMDKPKK